MATSFDTARTPHATERRATGALPVNVGCGERMASVAGGWILLRSSLRHGGLTGVLGAALGGMLVARGVTGYCALKASPERTNGRPGAADDRLSDQVGSDGHTPGAAGI